MLDIKFIRENKEIVERAAKLKRVEVDINKLIELDDRRKTLQLLIDEKRALQNAENSRMRNGTEDERQQIIQKMSVVKEEAKQLEEQLQVVMDEWRKLMLQVPNVPDMSVPEGESDADNKEVKVWGEKRVFDFTPKDHIELMESLDMVDLERGTKVAGFRGYYLKNDGALLQFALWKFVNDFFEKKGGFTSMVVPSLVKKELLLGTGYLPQGEEDLYKTQDESYMSGTAEVGVMGYFMDEVLNKSDLPRKIIAFSPCYRREAGAHGKDVKGLYRVHEFYKLEQVVLCEASHEESVKHHEELLQNAEGLLQALELPYRVVVNCGGDLGLGQVKKYDIETWMPSKEKYGETHSCSYFHDFQTRRLNIKYRDIDGALKLAHSLNNTALATTRILIQLTENHQQADGSIKIPEILRPYMGGREFIKKA